MRNLTKALLGVGVISAGLISASAQAAAPGITGPSFNLVAAPGYISQPDGSSVYSWGYGCNGGGTPAGFLPAGMPGASCPAGAMQLPGPTLIVTEGASVSVTLTNNLPAAAGNTSMLFPGFDVTATTPAQPGGCSAPATPTSLGVLTTEVLPGCAVTYSFMASTPGTHTYYSGTQGDLQIEMGLYGALIVLPSATPASCAGTSNDAARSARSHPDFRLANAAYDHPSACYDREYLFQFSEMDPGIHRQAEEQATRTCTGCMVVPTEPYVPAYFMINGRSMPDDMDPNYALAYPRQPYNGNPHMHPGEHVLLRIIGNGRWQHPFHQHGNHTRILARDGNLLLAPGTSSTRGLAGPALFTTTTTPGQTMDGIFLWTGKGLNWDVFGHGYDGDTTPPTTSAECDADGYYTAVPAAENYYEWCQDHRKPLETKPFGTVGSGGPVTLPDANILAQGPWYGGSPYFGPEANARAVGATPIPPSGTIANGPGDEAGFAFMWHSHNERELTTNNAFPGGMMMMMLVDPWGFLIDESK